MKLKTVALILMLCLLCGCAQIENKQDKLTVCVTLFPQYDFLRQIGGDKVEITLLLPSGMESHNFEPGVKDIEKIAKSHMFIYTGASMEPWAETIVESIDTNVKILDVSENVNICTHEHIYKEHHEHYSESDPHIWTSPKNALIMAENILKALCEADPKNSDYYKLNAEKYFDKLKSLDEEFTELSQKAKGIILCHGGKFSMSYLTRDYGIEFLSAYDSCSSFSEPSVLRIKQIIDKVNQQKLNGIFCEELNRGRVAETISNETDVPVLLLHTCHNLTNDEFQRGETYISLMRKNAENIRKVIGDA